MHVTLVVTKSDIEPIWILCDNESTADIFKNQCILINIRRAKKPIWLKRNTIEVNEEADLLGYGTVYYHSQVAVNVMWLKGLNL